MFELSDLVVVFILSMLAWLWWNTQAVRLLARQMAKRHCEKMDVQMLDDSVAGCRFSFRMDKRSGIRILRVFRFEFTSTGDERYKGVITFLVLM